MDDLSAPLRTMKRIIILLLALMPIVASAQEFNYDNQKITWKKVYQSELTIDDIYKCIITSNNFYDVEQLEGCIVAKTKPIDYKPEDYGFRWGNSNTLLLNGAVGPVALRIEVKEGRYRVIASDMMVTDITPGGMTPMGTKTRLEDVAFRRGVPNSMMTDQFAPVFRKYIERLVSFTKEDDKW